MIPRIAQPEDITPAARLWHAAWHETQSPFVPRALSDLRTNQSFIDRLYDMGNLVRVAGPVGAPIGICAIKTDELDQLFVAPPARGSGVAAALLKDAELRLIAQGSTSATLDCLVENEAALQFYRRHGWDGTQIEIAQLDTSEGPFDMPCLILRKDLH